VDVQYTEKFMEDFREAQQDLWSFALGLFSGFAFAVEVPIGGEIGFDLIGLKCGFASTRCLAAKLDCNIHG